MWTGRHFVALLLFVLVYVLSDQHVDGEMVRNDYGCSGTRLCSFEDLLDPSCELGVLKTLDIDETCFDGSRTPPWLEFKTKIYTKMNISRLDVPLFFIENAYFDTYPIGYNYQGDLSEDIMVPRVPFQIRSHPFFNESSIVYREEREKYDAIFGEYDDFESCVGGPAYLWTHGQLGGLESSNILRASTYQKNCTVVFGGLQIVMRENEKRLLDDLKIVRRIHQDGLIIFNTSAKEIEAPKLARMYIWPEGTICSPSIEIIGNAQLEQIDFPRLEPQNVATCDKIKNKSIVVLGNPRLNFSDTELYENFKGRILTDEDFVVEPRRNYAKFITKEVRLKEMEELPTTEKPRPKPKRDDLTPLIVVSAIAGVQLIVLILLAIFFHPKQKDEKASQSAVPVQKKKSEAPAAVKSKPSGKSDKKSVTNSPSSKTPEKGKSAPPAAKSR